MSTTVQTTASAPAAGRGPAPSAPVLLRVRRWLGRNALRIYGAIAFTYLFTPIAYITVFSFNNGGKSNLVWRSFWRSGAWSRQGKLETLGVGENL